MKPISKLKDQARLHELNEDWDKAINAYLQVLRIGEQWEAEADLALFNRIGDLYLRLKRPAEAVSYYEQAADKYAEAGLYNNAIALCNKALRYMPDHLELYRKLGQLSAHQGFLTDARRWYLEYAEHKSRAGELDDAFEALSDFAALAEDPDVRELLGRKLHAHGRSDEALDELTQAYVLRTRAGQTEQADALRKEIGEIDPGATDSLASALEQAFARPEAGADLSDGAVELPGLGLETAAGAAGLAEEEERGGVEVGPDLGLEPTALSTPDEAAVAGLEEADAEAEAEPAEEPTEEAGQDLAARGEAVADAPPLDADAAALSEQGGEAELVGEGQEGEPAPLPLISPDEGEVVEDASAAADLADALAEVEEDDAPPLPLLAAPEEASPPLLAAPEEASPPLLQAPSVERQDTDAAATRRGEAARAEELPDLDSMVAEARQCLARGERAGALDLLGSLHATYAEAGDLDLALAAVGELLRIDRDNVQGHQHRVEYAFRSGDQHRLVEAYLELAACLRRRGEETKARAVYQGVLDLEPGNETALAAMQAAAGAGMGTGEEYVDLGSFLEPEEDTSGETTRFVVEEKAPSGDEERDFAELLSQFKAKVSERVGEDDPSSHYDLGLAFKEMGLLDEAIAEFQVALRGGQHRLMVYEELGQCFMEKGQYNVALKVLQRAVQLPHDDETEVMGVYYHLGRCHEELGQVAEAKDAYERVLGVDLRFRDVAERLARL